MRPAEIAPKPAQSDPSISLLVSWNRILSLRSPNRTGMDTLLLFLINKQWINPVLDRLMAICSNFDLWRPVLLVAVLLLFWRGGVPLVSAFVVYLVSVAL